MLMPGLPYFILIYFIVFLGETGCFYIQLFSSPRMIHVRMNVIV